MKKLFLLLVAIILALPLAAQFKAKMVFITSGEERAFNVFSSDEGYRYEFDEDGQEGIFIVKNESQNVIILMPQQKMAMKSPIDSPMNLANDPIGSFKNHQKNGTLKKVGKETINGIECTKSELYNKDNLNQKTFTIWISEKYEFPMKMINHIDGIEESGMELRDIEPWTPDANSFEIPSGYQVMDMPNMMPDR